MLIAYKRVNNFKAAIMSFYRVFTLCILVVVLRSPANAQEWMVDSVQHESGLLAIKIDALGNHYVVTEEMQIIKYNPKGTIRNTYNNNRLGSIGRLDVSNPFLILVYYPQYQTAVLLDNNLSESGRIRFSDIGIGNIRSAAVSDDNNLWVFDEGARNIIKVSTNGHILFKGIPCFNFDIDDSRPFEIMQRGGYLYICQQDSPVRIFDIYGKWVKSLLLDNFQAMIYLDKIIYYKADNKIYSHNTELPMLGDTVLWEAGNVYSICYDTREICFYGINSTGEIVKLNVR